MRILYANAQMRAAARSELVARQGGGGHHITTATQECVRGKHGRCQSEECCCMCHEATKAIEIPRHMVSRSIGRVAAAAAVLLLCLIFSLRPAAAQVLESSYSEETAATIPDDAQSHTVEIDWEASPSTVNGYYVYRGTASGGPYAQIAATNAGTLAYVDAVVANNQTYYYVVTAYITGSGRPRSGTIWTRWVNGEGGPGISIGG